MTAGDSKNPAPLPTRRDIEVALRAAGLSHRQARKFIGLGWRALVDEHQLEFDELSAQLDALRDNLKRV